jgi:hypothetical protein
MISNEIVNQYFQAKEALDQITSEHYLNLNELDAKLSREKCPTFDETKIILYSIKEFALSFADYLERIRELAKSPITVIKLAKNLDVEIVVTKQALQTLTKPYGIAINLQNSFYVKNLPTSKHWERVFELISWYAYFGSNTTIKNSLISRIWSVKTCFDDEKSDDEAIELYCKHIISVVRDEYLAGLRYMSNRATFLMKTKKDSEIEAGDVNWWCDKMDSSVSDTDLRYLLENCPNPKDERVITKLKELVKSKAEISQEILEQISLLIKNSG